MKDLHPFFPIAKRRLRLLSSLPFILCTYPTEYMVRLVLPACRLDCMMSTDTGKRMLSLQALLNPASPGYSVTCFRQSDSVMAAASTLQPTEAQTAIDVSSPLKAQSPASVVSMTKSKPLGSINFAPFEEIDQTSYREMCRFRVSPFGKIRQSCQRIPYNSSKKDFFEKTGRESIEGKGDSLPKR